MNKWFHRINKKDQKRIFNYLEKLKHITNEKLKIETMMMKTKYLEPFCAECVEEWNRAQDSKSIREIDDNSVHSVIQFQQEELF